MREAMLLLVFISTFLMIVWIFYYFIILDKKVKRRINYYLNADKKDKPKVKKKSDIQKIKKINDLIGEKLANFNQEKISQHLKSAGINMAPEEFIMFRWVLTAATGGTFFLMLGNLFFMLPGGILGYMVPSLWVNSKRKSRVKKFNAGLADMISTMVGSLRSGYSFPQAMKSVAEESESPIKDEVETLLREMSYGVSVEEAMNNMNKRMPSDDLDIMTQVILIQRQVGGNLAEVLEIIVKTIRDRNKIQQQVQTLTAQGRLSGMVIGALPVILCLIIYMINPEYMSSLFSSTLGIIMLSYGAVSEIIGFALINKLTKIEV